MPHAHTWERRKELYQCSDCKIQTYDPPVISNTDAATLVRQRNAEIEDGQRNGFRRTDGYAPSPREVRIDAGLCPDCGLPAVPGRRRCQHHLARNREYVKNYYARQRDD